MKKVTLWAVLPAMLVLVAVGCNNSSTVKNPDNNEKLTLTVPNEVKVKQGDSAKVDISIKRKDLGGAVTIDFKDLPAGTSIKGESKIASGDDKATFTLHADKEAKVVDKHDSKVWATSEDGKIKVDKIMKVTVQENK